MEHLLNQLYRWFAFIYFWLAERLYNELAWFYDAASWIVSLGQWDDWRKCVLDFLAGEDVLEIGFGTGELLLEMAHRNLRVVGLDSSKAMHRITGEKLHRQGLQVPRLLGVIQRTPFADDSFDTIVSTFPAGYIFDLETWREIARLLRKNTPSLEPIRSRFIVVGLYVIRARRRHLKFTTTLLKHSYDEVDERIHRLAESVGLNLHIEIRPFPGHDLPINIVEQAR